jgi:hypothetical protein
VLKTGRFYPVSKPVDPKLDVRAKNPIWREKKKQRRQILVGQSLTGEKNFRKFGGKKESGKRDIFVKSNS